MKINSSFKIIFALAFLVLVAVLPQKTSAGTDWYNSNWSYRKEIIIDHTKIPNTDQINFPVLVSLTDSDLQAGAMSDGGDILFTDATGINKIPYEREKYDGATGTLVAWVSVANLSYSNDTIIYLYYGNPAASDQQDVTGVVWGENFAGVWHSGDATNSTTLFDSTVNKNTGVKYGTIGPVEVSGKIGNAQGYTETDDGSGNLSGDYIGVVPASTLSAPFTISAWAKVVDDQNTHTVIGTRSPNDSGFDFKFDNGDNIHGDIGDGTNWMSTGADVDPAVFTYATDTWYKITYVVTIDGYSIYVNGADVADGTYDTPGTPLLFDADHNFFIGQVGYGDEWFNGAIDEVRLSSVARSADWIQTEYNNENDPTAFYNMSAQELAPVPVPAPVPTPVPTPTPVVSSGGGGGGGNGLSILVMMNRALQAPTPTPAYVSVPAPMPVPIVAAVPVIPVAQSPVKAVAKVVTKSVVKAKPAVQELVQSPAPKSEQIVTAKTPKPGNLISTGSLAALASVFNFVVNGSWLLIMLLAALTGVILFGIIYLFKKR